MLIFKCLMHNKQDMIYLCQIKMDCVYAFAVPFDNPLLDETKFNRLFTYDFIRVKYCSRWGVKKVYCIIEDLS